MSTGENNLDPVTLRAVATVMRADAKRLRKQMAARVLGRDRHHVADGMTKSLDSYAVYLDQVAGRLSLQQAPATEMTGIVKEEPDARKAG